MTRTCGNCHHWEACEGGLGICRGDLPKVGHIRGEISVMSVALATYWPVTAANSRCAHWCGIEPDLRGMLEALLNGRRQLKLDVAHDGGVCLTQGKRVVFANTVEEAVAEMLQRSE